ncbi:MAG: DUF4465 domain-containing protein, partial [Bacteroidetes bacterium]|nr:DUF4465 domain-containing protein [Bacteroidota bacterium]
ISFDSAQIVSGMFITNSTYTYKIMKNGNQFSKKFGGASGNDKDYLRVWAMGYKNDTLKDSNAFYLGNYTFNTSASDYLINDWTWWDLSVLREIDSLYFRFEGTDTNQFGLNTPTYFCMDNFNGIAPNTKLGKASADHFSLANESFYNGNDLAGGFLDSGAYFVNNYNENWKSWSGFSYSNTTDTSTAGFTNQYSAITGTGVNSNNYVIASGSGATIELPYHAAGAKLKGVYITNATYTALSMKDGDDFAKKFGGIDGNDPDWFKVEFVGLDINGNAIDTVEHYLADYRFADNSKDYIVTDWQWLSLAQLSGSVQIKCYLSSSDNSSWGINTPEYFCLDNFNSSMPIKVEEMESSEIGIYPNPTANWLFFSTKQSGEIFSTSGKMMMSFSKENMLNVQKLPSGTYLVKWLSDNYVKPSIFIKE